MSDEPRILSHPELVIGIAGPIGIDIEAISDEIGQALTQVGYDHTIIRATDLMKAYPAPGVTQQGTDYFSSMNFKMDYANKLCELGGDAEAGGDPEFLMRIAIEGIRDAREAALVSRSGSTARVASETAYIVRQLKRPDEVRFMRRVYGKQFILVSGYGSEQHRRDRLLEKGRATLPLSTPAPDIEKDVSAILLSRP